MYRLSGPFFTKPLDSVVLMACMHPFQILSKANGQKWWDFCLTCHTIFYTPDYLDYRVDISATVQINLNFTFTHVSHMNYSTNLLSYSRVTHECMIQYHNSILDACEQCTHEVYHLRVTYCMLRVNCTHIHLWIILLLIFRSVHNIQTLPGHEL